MMILWVIVGLLLVIPVVLTLLDSGLRLVYLLAAAHHKNSILTPSDHSLKLLFLIVARDEEPLMEDVLTGVQKEIRDGDSMVVIADNCQDATSQRAEDAGATVFIRKGGNPGKGAALGWFAGSAAAKIHQHAAVIILDADTLLQPGFRKAVVCGLSAGKKVLQGFIQPLTPENGSYSILAAYSELLSQLIDDTARTRLGWDVPLRGTGTVLSEELFRRFAPKLQTQTDDIELSLLLADNGIVVGFLPQAIVNDPKTGGVGGLARQRGRWLVGQRQVWHSYTNRIGSLFCRGAAGWSLLQALLLKPKTLMLIMKFLLLGAAFLLPYGNNWLVCVLKVCVFAAILLDLCYYLWGLRYVSQPLPYLRALLKAPLFLLVWIRGWLYSLHGANTWLRARPGQPGKENKA